MFKTIEALYENGKIIPLNDVIPFKKAKVLITILEEKNTEGMKAGDLIKFKGILKNFPEDPVEYQRRIRDE